MFEIAEILNRISECEIMGKPTVLLCMLIRNPIPIIVLLFNGELNAYLQKRTTTIVANYLELEKCINLCALLSHQRYNYHRQQEQVQLQSPRSPLIQ